MKRVFASVIFVTGISVFSVCAAQPVTLDFDDLELAGKGTTDLTSYSNSSFLISDTVGSSTSFSVPKQGNAFYFGSANLIYNFHDPGDWAILSSLTGDPFTLNSMDLHGVLGGAQTVNFYAYDATQTQVGNAFLSFDDATAWHTLSFGPDFRDVYSVRWHQDYPYHSVDKIVLNSSVVPEPVSFLLYGLGGLCLAAFRRK